MASQRMIRKALVLVGGTLLLAIGVVGVVVPIMPGVIFLIAGLLLMSTEFAWADRALNSARRWIDERRSKSQDRKTSSETDTGTPQTMRDTSA